MSVPGGARFNVGLVQMRSGLSPQANLDAAVRLIAEARDAGADYVLTPEMTNILEVKRERLFAAILPEESDSSLAAFRELASKGTAKLLEPIMKVEVVTPDEFLGGVIGDLNSRRGHVHGTDTRGNAQIVTAMVPLANMFGYINTLRSMTQGRAQYTMQFDHYEQVPQSIADEVKAKYA